MTEWKPVLGYEGLYEVSNDGRVRSLDRKDRMGRDRIGRELAQGNINTGYRKVDLKHNGKKSSKTVHRIVCDAFLGTAPDMWVNHKDGDKNNNHLSNLEWVTPSDNHRHAYSTGLRSCVTAKGSNGRYIANAR